MPATDTDDHLRERVREKTLPNAGGDDEIDLAHLAILQIFTIPTGLNSQEQDFRRRLATALQGNAAPGKHAADAYHLAEAAKYGGYVITHDERVLKKSGTLQDLLPPSLQVVTLKRFLEIFDEYEAAS